MKQNKKNASVSELVKWLFKQSEFLSFIYKTKRGKKKNLYLNRKLTASFLEVAKKLVW